MATTKPAIISKDSALAVLAVEVARRHRPVVRGEMVTCRSCETAWMCPAHTNAEDTLRAAGLSLRDHDGCDDTVESGLEAVPLGSDQTQRIAPRKPALPVVEAATADSDTPDSETSPDSDETQRITPAASQPTAGADPAPAAKPTMPGQALAIRGPQVRAATDAVAA